MRGGPIALLLCAAVLAACNAAVSVTPGGVIAVAAAENFWGNLAGQLGGTHVAVTSIVSDPNADPHEHESSAADARAFAAAAYVIFTGAGYDIWAEQLLGASPSSARTVLDVAGMLGRHTGDNPHFWYSEQYVLRVVDRITADLSRIDPLDRAYFAVRNAQVMTSLLPYRTTIAAIRSRFSGARIGATESIAVYYAQTLGLDLVSPPAFMDAVAEGNEPPADSVAVMHDLITSRSIRVLIYNVQTATAVTTNLHDLARQSGIAVVGISETMQPPTTSFQQWQLSQLEQLQQALAATGVK